MRIVKANLEDAKNIAKVELRSGYRHPPNFDINEAITQILKGEKEKVFIAKEKHRVVGYIALSLKNKYVEILFFAVDKKYQKKGVGSKLLNFAINFAKKNKYKKILLEVRSKNFNAIKLYTNYNFYIVGIKRKKNLSGDKKIIMQKDLVRYSKSYMKNLFKNI